MNVTKAKPKTGKAAGNDDKTRFLHVPVTARFLQRVNMAASAKGLNVRDYVTSTLERAWTGGKA